MKPHSISREPIAVVGVSALFPGSQDAAGFWRDILAGKDLLSDIPQSHWLVEDYFDANPAAPDKTYAKRGGFLQPVDFDALGFGIPPSTMPATDTSQLLALIVAQQVLEDVAREKIDQLDRSRISVILGVTSAQELLFSMVSRLQKPVWVKALRETGLAESDVQTACARIADQYVPWQEASFPGLLGNVVAGRIANRLNLGGTNCVTDAACASSFSALAMAVNELHLHESDLVITGGVDTLNDIFMYMCFSKTPALSPSGDCRPFSDQADGTMLGEGLGMVALKRLSDAERDGDKIYALIKGVGTSSDGRSKSVYAPVSEGQAKALQRAYTQAGYGPETVELMEAHGTGTKAGDAAEFEGLRSVFDASDAGGRLFAQQWCALGSIKSQIGHTKAAAGAAGLFKAVMALHHKVLPPTIKVERPNPKLDLPNSPFYLNTRARPWIRGSDHPRRASVSAFGFGGSNFHIALEEYTGSQRAERIASQGHELFALSADNAADLLAQLQRLDNQLGVEPWHALAAQSRGQFHPSAEFRFCAVADQLTSLRSQLHAARSKIQQDPLCAFFAPDWSFGVGPCQGKLALVFPGQGSQYPEMGSELAQHFEAARALHDQLADVPFAAQNTPLQERMFPRPQQSPEQDAARADALLATEIAQPALAASSLAALAVLSSLGVQADAVAGHSFGELTALCAAQALDSSTCVQLARARGLAMRDAARQARAEPADASQAIASGAMCAVSSDRASLEPLIASCSGILNLANHNAPQQAVVSGEMAAIDQLEAKLSAQKIAFKRLNVASAFHSPIVAAASKEFALKLADVALQAPNCAFYSNTTPRLESPHAEQLKTLLAEQISKPVLFVDMIQAMHADGVRCFLEVGPSAVLTGLIGSILQDQPHCAIATDRKQKSGVQSMLLAAAKLAALGHHICLERLFKDCRSNPPRIRSGKMPIQISGANFGKPYPPADLSTLPVANPERELPAAVAPRSTVQAADAFYPISSPHVVSEGAAPIHHDLHASAPHPFREPSLDSTKPMTASSSAQLPTLPVAHATTVVHDPLLSVFLETQRQTAAAHSAYQQSMADSHNAYLKLAETALLGINALLGAPAPTGALVAKPMPLMPATHAMPLMPLMPLMPSVAVAAPVTVSGTAAIGNAAPRAAPVPAAIPSVNLVAPSAVAQPKPALDLTALMLSVVAEKTGYPAEMLRLEMDMEGDLGIDSIKRVEILASMEERSPVRLDRTRLGSMRTLQEIVSEFSKHAAPESAETPVAARPLPTQQQPTAAQATPAPQHAPNSLQGIDYRQLVLKVVEEKTGYPLDMLNENMDLEGDLGIDSIKRVEILARVEERAPGLASAERHMLAGMRTLAEIIGYLSQLAPSIKPAQAPHAAPATAPTNTSLSATAPPDANQLKALLLAVVAAKTGYPVDMLNMTMDLEGDLGIDSIKRVEIMASVSERMQQTSLDTQNLSSARTLAEILQRLARTDHANPPALVNSEVLAADLTPKPSTAAAQTDAGSLARFVLRKLPAPAIGMAMSGLFGTKIHVTGEPKSSEALVAELNQRGLDAIIAEPSSDCRALIDLTGLGLCESPAQAMQLQLQCFGRARVLAGRYSEQGGLFVTVQNTGGFGMGVCDPQQAWLSGFPALIKTAALEWPKAQLKAIDIAANGRSFAQIAAQIADELLSGGGEIEVALGAAGERSTLASVAKPVRADSPQFGLETPVVVVSGGARGVTAACMLAWAKQQTLKLVLLGRTELAEERESTQALNDPADIKKALLAAHLALSAGASPTPKMIASELQQLLAAREVRDTLTQLHALGSEALYVAVNVQDAAALEAAFASARHKFGPISALVHGAGVLADKRIAEKTDAQFQSVMDAKVAGLHALLQASQRDPLKLLVVFSSVSARCGNTGQADYAMANEIIAKVARAEARRRPGLRVKSMGWGPWEGGMVNPALKARFAELGVPMIPLHAGAQMFVQEINDARVDGVELVLGGEPRPEALLSAGNEQRMVKLELSVNSLSHGYLNGHAVDGFPVLPAVLVADWFARTASGLRPGMRLQAIRDLRVIKGVRLERVTQSAQHFSVEACSAGSAQGLQNWALRLLDAQGKLRYQASIELANGDAPLPASAARAQIRTEPYSGGALYDQALFHRGAFELIDALHSLSEEGAEASLRGIHAAGWNAEPWAEAWNLDVAGIDASLQLAVVLGQKMLGGPNLPMSIASLRQFGVPSAGTLRATVYRKKLGNSELTTDIFIVDAAGNVCAELLGVQNVALPRAQWTASAA